MRQSARFWITVIGLVCVGMQGSVLGQTLKGYKNSSSIDMLTPDEAYDLFAEWKTILSPNLDDLPTDRETEIYQTIMRAEGDIKPLTSFNLEENRWKSVNLAELPGKIKFCKELAWLVPAMHENDSLLALRNPAGDMCWVSGKPSVTWIHAGKSGPNGINTYGGDGSISPMAIGTCARSLTELANWILEHPELYPQKAPANSVIPLTIPGSTYYDRAKFYLEEVKKTYEICIGAGMHWEFDSSGEGHAWVWLGSRDKIDALKVGRKANPAGIPIAEIRTVSNEGDFGLHPYNRVFSYLSGYQQCAEGLRKIDEIEGTSVHAQFCDTAFDFVEKGLNSWRYWRVPYTEAEPIGANFAWPYSPERDPVTSYEDGVHFMMDIEFMSGIRHLLDRDDLKGISGAIYSRHFDPEAQVVFRQINRTYVYDDVTGEIVSKLWWLAPGLQSWVGEGGSEGHMQGVVTLSLEIFDEQMRKMAEDPKLKKELLGRANTRRTRNIKSPFEIYDLKLARNARGLTRTPARNTPPRFISSPKMKVKVDAPPGSVVGTVSGKDPDHGQTLRYWITGGNINNCFKIDSNTGKIRTNKLYPLALSKGEEVALEITAMDDGVPMQLATTTVHITAK